MHKHKRNSILVLFFLVFMGKGILCAQNDFKSPDKCFLHLDRNLYAQGDTIWIKGYAFERGSNKPSNKSYAIHVQLLTSEGKMVNDSKLLAVNGEARGQLPIFDVMAPGFYQLVAHTGYMKNFDERFFFKTSIEIREKTRRYTIKTLFDKPSYVIGDTAEIEFSVIAQNQTPVSKATFIYSYSNNEKKAKRQKLRCSEDGTVSIKLPITSGSYYDPPRLDLRFYEDVAATVARDQAVYLPMKKDVINLLFFPEGGDLIEGISGKVAFKATDNEGCAVDIEGELYADGQKINSVSSIHEGMGLFSLQPKAMTYSFKVTAPAGIDSVYQLPEVKPQGYSIAYRNQTDEVVYLQISHTFKEKQSCKLWISYCDQLLDVISFDIASNARIPIPKETLPSGIVTFTLSNANDVPQAERIVYVEKPSPQLDIVLSKPAYEAREKVELSISSNTPTRPQLSYVVVDSLLGMNPNISTSSIKAYAELETELKGRINNIGQYLGNTNSVRNKRDLLLLTHGWRRFVWLENRRQLQSINTHDFNEVCGSVKRLGKPYEDAEVSAYMIGKTIATTNLKADEYGKFCITPIYKDPIDQDILIMAKTKRSLTTVNLTLQLTDTFRFTEVIANNKDKLNSLIRSNHRRIETDGKEGTVVEEPFMQYNTKILDEIEVVGHMQDWGVSEYFRRSDEAKLGTELEDENSFLDLLAQVSGRIDVETEMETGRIIIETYRNDFDKLSVPIDLHLLFDSFNPPAAMIYVNDKPWGYEARNLDLLDVSDISGIAVFDGRQGEERFGTEAYYGAILIYTYLPGVVEALDIKRSHAVFGNFVKAREFQKAIFETKKQNHRVAIDKRVTLQWEPFLAFDKDGNAKETFYTGDIAGQKQIIVQGFDADGNLYYQKAHFEVKELFSE